MMRKQWFRFVAAMGVVLSMTAGMLSATALNVDETSTMSGGYPAKGGLTQGTFYSDKNPSNGWHFLYVPKGEYATASYQAMNTFYYDGWDHNWCFSNNVAPVSDTQGPNWEYGRMSDAKCGSTDTRDIAYAYQVSDDGVYELNSAPLSLLGTPTDGYVNVAVYQNDQRIWPAYGKWMKVTVGQSVVMPAITTAAESGDMFYFRVNCGDNPSNDNLVWNPSVKRTAGGYTVGADLGEQAKIKPAETYASRDASAALAMNDAEKNKGWSFESYSYADRTFTKLDKVDSSSGWLYTGDTLWGSSLGAINKPPRTHPGNNGGAVVSFTMPRDGTVKLSARNNAITVNSGAKIAVFKGSVKIWPSGSAWAAVDSGVTALDLGGLTVSGLAGDQLRFVIAKHDTLSIGEVGIDPTVTYENLTYNADLDLERKTATESAYDFKAQFSATDNPSGQWNYLYAQIGDDLALKLPDSDGTNWRMGSGYTAGLIHKNGAAAGVDNDPVIAFKAPFSGRVTVGLENGNLSLSGSAGASDAGDGAAFGIFLRSEGELVRNIYPGGTDMNKLQAIENGTATTTLQVGSVTLDVKKNQYVWFRTNRGPVQNWHDNLTFNPVITYIDIDRDDPGVADEGESAIVPASAGSSLTAGQYPLVSRNDGTAGSVSGKTSEELSNLLKSGIAANTTYTSSDNNTLGIYGSGTLRIDGKNAKIVLSPTGSDPSPDGRFALFAQGYSDLTLENLTLYVPGGAPLAIFNTWNVGKLTLKNVEIVVGANVGKNGGDIPIVRLDNPDGVTTDFVLDRVRIVANDAKKTGVNTNKAADATVMNSYIQGGKHAVDDNSLYGSYIANNVFEGQAAAGVSANTDFANVQKNTITAASGVVVQQGKQNTLIGLNKITCTGGAITAYGAKNTAVVRNETKGGIAFRNGSKNANVVDNLLTGGAIELNDTSYALVSGNTGTVAAHTATNAYGDNIYDDSARAQNGVESNLLPKLDKELFTGAPRRDSFNVEGTRVTLKEYLNKALRRTDTALLPPGAYTSATLGFNALDGATVYAYGTLGEFESYTSPAVSMNGCTDVAIKGLTITHRYNGNAQGTVVAKSGGNAYVLADPGYLPDFSDTRYYSASGGGQVFKPDANGRFELSYADVGFGTHSYDPVTRLNTLPLSGDANQKVQVGDKVILRGNGSHVNSLSGCSGILYEDVGILNGSGFAFMEHSGDRATVLRRVAVTTAAAPLLTQSEAQFYQTYGASTPQGNAIAQSLVRTDGTGRLRGPDRLISTCDATHSTNMRNGLQAYHCIFEKMTDDATNVNGEFGKVVSVNGGTLVYTKGDNRYVGINAPFRAGDHVLVFTRAGKLLADTFAQSATVPLGGDQYQITLQDSFTLEPGALIENESANGRGFVFDNCYVDNNRSRGFLIKAYDGKIIHNTIKNNGMSAILVKAEIEDGWSECGPTQNLLIADNLLENSGYYTGSVLHSPINISGDGQFTSDPQYLLHKNITIRDNVIKDRNTLYAININSAQTVTISGNTFGPRKGYTDATDSAPAVYLNGVDGVTVSGNGYPSGVTQKVEVTAISRHVTGTDVGMILADYLQTSVDTVFVDNAWKLKLTAANLSGETLSATFRVASATAGLLESGAERQIQNIPAGKTVSIYYGIATLPSNMNPPLNAGDVSFAVSLSNGAEGALTAKAYFNATPKAAAAVSGASDAAWNQAGALPKSSDSPDNLSMRVKTLWDAAKFYLLVDVTDDVHSQTKAADSMWEADSVQFAVDPARDAGYGSAGQIELTFGLINGTTPTAYIHSNTIAGTPQPVGGIAASAVGLQITRNDTTKHTVYFAAIPWSLIGKNGAAPAENANVGFNVALNDSDGGGRSYIELYGGIASSKKAENFGATRLLGASVSTYAVAVSSTAGGSASAHTPRAGAGDTVLLTATAASGYRFDGWQLSGGASPENAASAMTSFVMPASAVTARALFTAIPRNQTVSGTVIQNGVATLAVTEEQVNALAAALNGSADRLVVIRPENTGDTTKTEVALPAASVARLAAGGLDLAVQTPQGRVTIPNEALASLKGKGGISVYTAIDANGGISVEIRAGADALESLTGGIRVAVAAGGGSTLVPVLSDGSVVRKSAPRGGEMLLWLEGSARFTLEDRPGGLSDIQNRWSANEIRFASARGLLVGTPENRFNPGAILTRAMLIAALHRLDGQIGEADETGFADVPDGAWYGASASWAIRNGVVSDAGDGLFLPESGVTREALCGILYRYFRHLGIALSSGGSLSDFADGRTVSSEQRDAVSWAVGSGLLSGLPGKRLDPQGSVTREQLAAVLERAVGLLVQ